MRGIVKMTSVCPPLRGLGRYFDMEAGPRDEAVQSLDEIYRDLAALLLRIAIQRFHIQVHFQFYCSRFRPSSSMLNEVSRLVNDPRNDSPACITPADWQSPGPLFEIS